MLVLLLFVFNLLIPSSWSEETILIDDFNSYKDTKDFLEVWKSRRDGYKKILNNNSYYYYLRPDPFIPEKKCLCSALREYPKGYVRTDIPSEDIKMVIGPEGEVKAVTIYKDYWLKKIKINNCHNQGKEVFLEWEWMAYKLPEGALDEVEGMDDHAMSLYAVLYIGWMRFRVIKYIWSATDNTGMIPVEKTTDKDKRVYIASNKKTPLGKWIKVSVNLSKAIKDFMPDRYDDVTIAAISLLADSDDVKKPTQACIRNIKLVVRP